jgi:hypothetical protein
MMIARPKRLVTRRLVDFGVAVASFTVLLWIMLGG